MEDCEKKLFLKSKAILFYEDVWPGYEMNQRTQVNRKLENEGLMQLES